MHALMNCGGVALAILSILSIPVTASAQSAIEVDWGTYFGGYFDDYLEALAVLADGGAAITGITSSETGITTPGAHKVNIGLGWDAYVSRFDATGHLLWSTYYGGDDSEFGRAIAADPVRGAIYVAGLTDSDEQIATPGAYQEHRACPGQAVERSVGTCDSDGFIAKFDLAGDLVWGTYFGGPASVLEEQVTEEVAELAVDAAGNVYACGSTPSTEGIATPGAPQTTLDGGGFLAKFDADGELLWATYYSGPGCTGLAIDDARSAVYVSGSVTEPGFATPGAYQELLGGDNDAFLARFNTDGARVWATYYGGLGYDLGTGVAVDNEGAVYLTGPTFSSDGIATPGAYQESWAGVLDLFLVKFNPAGERQWGTYFGGPELDDVRAIAVAPGDAAANIYLAGYTGSPGLATPGAPRTELAGGIDALLVKFTGAGDLEWATYYGGEADDLGQDVDATVNGTVYLGGLSSSLQGIATPGAFRTEAMPPDGFLVRLLDEVEAPDESGATDTGDHQFGDAGCGCDSRSPHAPAGLLLGLVVVGLARARPRRGGRCHR